MTKRVLRSTTGALIREYVWLEGQLIAVIEGGVISFVRADHIGRPVFATNSAGAKVWTASYLPFGGVRTSTGTPSLLRFPGQWFQSESGLHQNWMRDYDPTTGRYIEADPLGLIDGASIFGYAKQNPGRWTDPRGLFTLDDARVSLYSRLAPYTAYCGYSETSVFDEWLRMERLKGRWWNDLPPCPCQLEPEEGVIVGPQWHHLQSAGIAEWYYHGYGGVSWAVRSLPNQAGQGNQCHYDAGGNLITHNPQ